MSVVEERVRVPRLRLWQILAVFGPGIIVQLANTDAGCVITAAQSGARWGYAMIVPQILLIPIVYVVQEITVRLGIATGKGHGELIRERFGTKWAYLSVSTLFLSAIGALITEFSGIAGVGALFGIPRYYSVGAATLCLIVLGFTAGYRQVERIGITVGLFELLLIPAAIMAHPSGHALWVGLKTLPIANASYLFLLAANVGAVVMPWMIFYQQSAVVERKLQPRHLRIERLDTGFGSILTQLIMMAVIIMTAATIGRTHPHQALNDVGQIADALLPFIGVAGAKVIFGLAMLGASFVAALVVSLAGAWGIGEVVGFRHSVDHTVKEAKGFYSIYALAHIAGALLVVVSINLVSLSVDTEVMNALLLPVVLGFLLLLEAKALPPQWRMHGLYKWVGWTLSAIVMAFGLYMGITIV